MPVPTPARTQELNNRTRCIHFSMDKENIYLPVSKMLKRLSVDYAYGVIHRVQKGLIHIGTESLLYYRISEDLYWLLGEPDLAVQELRHNIVKQITEKDGVQKELSPILHLIPEGKLQESDVVLLTLRLLQNVWKDEQLIFPLKELEERQAFLKSINWPL